MATMRDELVKSLGEHKDETTTIGDLLSEAINEESSHSDIDDVELAENMVDELLECGDRSSFPAPDRNDVDDIPNENPLKTLKDIVKAVTENYYEFARSILVDDFDTAAENMVLNLEGISNVVFSDGQKERLKERFKTSLMNI